MKLINLTLSDTVSIVQEWRDMKVKKKAKWIRKAMKEFREYEERVVEFKAGRLQKSCLGLIFFFVEPAVGAILISWLFCYAAIHAH
jgi:hypothetical protein